MCAQTRRALWLPLWRQPRQLGSREAALRQECAARQTDTFTSGTSEERVHRGPKAGTSNVTSLGTGSSQRRSSGNEVTKGGFTA